MLGDIDAKLVMFNRIAAMAKKCWPEISYEEININFNRLKLIDWYENHCPGCTGPADCLDGKGSKKVKGTLLNGQVWLEMRPCMKHHSTPAPVNELKGLIINLATRIGSLTRGIEGLVRARARNFGLSWLIGYAYNHVGRFFKTNELWDAKRRR